MPASPTTSSCACRALVPPPTLPASRWNQPASADRFNSRWNGGRSSGCGLRFLWFVSVHTLYNCHPERSASRHSQASILSSAESKDPDKLYPSNEASGNLSFALGLLTVALTWLSLGTQVGSVTV